MFSRRLILPAAAWLLLVLIGFAALSHYKAKSAEYKAAPSDWPANAGVAFDAGRYNIVMAIHPRCPCTRASLEELARLLAKCPRNVHLSFLVWRGASLAVDWETARVEAIAACFPEAKIIVDSDGVDAQRFGATTSGHLILYGQEGRLLFSGGITESRGHEGANSAADALLARLRDETSELCITPVFGCSLSGPRQPRN